MAVEVLSFVNEGLGHSSSMADLGDGTAVVIDLAERGTTFLAPAASRLDRNYQGLGDGEVVEVGRFRLEAIATPGHPPDHLSYLLSDERGPVAGTEPPPSGANGSATRCSRWTRTTSSPVVATGIALASG